ncbi:helix-turn-helix domain-containing protein [Hwanghaeella sp.]|uniref:helix-turn-helix domain-containing protein n=1 Tax=Hwanghaeella sp. TaxID=2605943 RepID=UPI003CCBAAC5
MLVGLYVNRFVTLTLQKGSIWMLNAAQIRAARGLIQWSQEDLAREAGVSRPTIKRMESQGPENSSAGNVDRVQKALEAAGVEFIAENGGGAGVRLRK